MQSLSTSRPASSSVMVFCSTSSYGTFDRGDLALIAVAR